MVNDYIELKKVEVIKKLWLQMITCYKILNVAYQNFKFVRSRLIRNFDEWIRIKFVTIKFHSIFRKRGGLL
jgi:hypothetical protein